MEQSKMVNRFQHSNVPLDVLKERAFNYRWAAVEEDVIPLTAADPDFPVAPQILDAIRSYIEPGILSYGPAEGLISFRESISKWYFETKDVNYSPGNILPVNSAAFGLFLAAQSILSPGDDALILEPVDFLFRKSLEHVGANIICSRLNKFNGGIDREEISKLITPKLKVIYLCNPNNPLGKAVRKDDLDWLANLAEQHDLYIISDEIWADINYDNSFISIASLNDTLRKRTIVVSGLSKNFGLAGLRIGYVCVGDDNLFKRIFEASKVTTTAFGISTLSQVAGTAALNESRDWLFEFKTHLKEMRDYTEGRLSKFDIFQSNQPDSTYLHFPQIRNTDMNSQELCDFILKKARVALVPGGKNWFEEGSEGHIRICYSTSKEILKEAFDRMELIF
mgnify:CR=1 FL=1